MMVFVLILLLLAALFGILSAVLKAVAFIVITVLLTMTVLAVLGWWAFKRSARRFTSGSPSAGSGALPPTRDDRY
jgi:hypothetical protein